MKTVLECIREAYIPRRRRINKDRDLKRNINVFACGGSGCGGSYSHSYSSGCGGGC